MVSVAAPDADEDALIELQASLIPIACFGCGPIRICGAPSVPGFLLLMFSERDSRMHRLILQARIWYRQRRFEDAKSEALRAADAFEKLGGCE